MNLMKWRFFLFFLFFSSVRILQAQNEAVLKQFLQTEGLRYAQVGISIQSVSDGKEIFSYCAESALTPASVAKLFPTALALYRKGGNERFQTSVEYTGCLTDGVLKGDLVIVAGGDPTLDSRYFPKYRFLDELMALLLQKGILSIEGKIRVEGALKGEQIPGSWTWEDVSNYYAAVYLPFNYRDNTFTLQYRTKETGTWAECVSMKPVLPGIEIRHEVIATSNEQDNAWIFGGPYSNILCVKGTIPANRNAFQIKGAIHDPAGVFVAELKTKLAQNHIRVEEKECSDTTRTLLKTFVSPTLSEIIYHTNKISVNLFAEALGKAIGEKDGVTNIKENLQQIGIDISGMILKDACGLSPMNAVPAKIFTDLLVYMGRNHIPDFIASLPIAGVDGGLIGYCYASPELKHRLKAKTGSMSGVRCLAGYLTRKDGTRLAFTILVNHYTCTVAQLQREMGRFLSHFL